MQKESIGQKVKNARVKKKLTQLQLAKRTGLAWNTIAKIETQGDSNPRFSTLESIAGALGISVEKLLR